jgi:hypothetical protein
VSPVKDEQVEIYQDVNFMRDIGPLSRRLNLMTKDFKNDENHKEVRQLQKRILNHFVEIDPALISSNPTQKNLNDEFLLALSGQVPLDKLLKRLAAIKDVKLWNQVDQSEFLSKGGQLLQNSPVPGGTATSEKMQAGSNEGIDYAN